MRKGSAHMHWQSTSWYYRTPLRWLPVGCARLSTCHRSQPSRQVRDELYHTRGAQLLHFLARRLGTVRYRQGTCFGFWSGPRCHRGRRARPTSIGAIHFLPISNSTSMAPCGMCPFGTLATEATVPSRQVRDELDHTLTKSPFLNCSR